MAILLQVQWVDQADPSTPSGHHSRIRHIGGISGDLSWKHSSAQAIESIERGHFAYYVEKDAGAVRLNVGRAADGGKFLIPNGETEQLLLSLPAFPAGTAVLH
jgi:hypothetical protein